MYTLVVNKDEKLGAVKPMNCVNNLLSWINMSAQKYYKKMGIPAVRTHDSRIMNSHLVDIPAIFPDFDADECDPASYDFAFTDVYMKNICSAGAKPFFRLGVTIENYSYLKPYDIVPPKDFAKWARICEHVVRHYNEGWADGLTLGIEYWEIWNEAENHPDPAKNPMWTGTFDQYIDLYVITANHLKKCFPDIKVGGYASCGFYEILTDTPDWALAQPERIAYFGEAFRAFCAAVTSEERRAPVDFFSWHSYACVKDVIEQMKYVREKLDENGLSGAESILNEWNPSTVESGTLKNAAEIASIIVEGQNLPVDMLMYYDLRGNTAYQGIFDRYTGKPYKAYYDFVWFNNLRKIGTAVKVEGAGEDLHATAAYDGKNGGILIANSSAKAQTFSLSGVSVGAVSHIASKKIGREGDTFTVPAYDVVYIRFA